VLNQTPHAPIRPQSSVPKPLQANEEEFKRVNQKKNMKPTTTNPEATSTANTLSLITNKQSLTKYLYQFVIFIKYLLKL
jgi:hypothetical protein